MQEACLAVLFVFVAGGFALPNYSPYGLIYSDTYERDVLVPQVTDKKYILPDGVIHYQFHPDSEKPMFREGRISREHIRKCLKSYPELRQDNYAVIGQWQYDSCFANEPDNKYECYKYKALAPELLNEFGFWSKLPDSRDEGNYHNKVGPLTPEKVIGDEEILKSCKRVATIVGNGCRLFAIKRQCFQTILMRAEIIRKAMYTDFLKRVPVFLNLPEEKLNQIADVLEEVTYANGDYIIHQGEKGDSFFIISKGQVNITMEMPESHEQKYIRTLHDLEFFGEKALEGDHIRTANVIADDGVTCLMIDGETYKLIISGLDELRKARY